MNNSTFKLLLKALNWAITQGFDPYQFHYGDGDNFNEAFQSIGKSIEDLQKQGITYASIWITVDNHNFELDSYTTHEEAMAEYTNEGRWTSDPYVAFFEDGFTLEVHQA